MKKAIKINLGGQVFHIDEDAYDKLKSYLDAISSHFSNVQESQEIIDDIENRISELLLEKLTDQGRVITLKEVNEIIEIMGKPEEIADEDDTAEEKRNFSYQRKRSRRLYRDPDNSVFGGVAAGLSAYFNLDLLLVRILFVVLILAGFGFPLILYLVLWIAVPKALTTAEKLEMQGEKVNVSNLEKKIREEYEDVKENLKKARNTETGKKTENFFQEFFRVIGVIIIAFAKIVLAFIALGFVIAGISLIASMIGIAFFGAGVGTWGGIHLWGNGLHDILTPFINPVNLTVIAIAAILLILIPVLVIIYGLFKALFRFKAKDRGLGMSALALWILSLATVITLGILEGKEYIENEKVTSNFLFDGLQSDTLYLSINDDQEKLKKNAEEFGFDDERSYFKGMDGELYGKVEIDFRSTNDNFFSIKVDKSSFGSNFSEALRFAENINYSFTRTDSLLIMDPYFKSEYEKKWRAQHVEVIVYIPEGKAVNFEKGLSPYVDNASNENHYSPWKMAGKTWLMKNKKLSEAGR